VLLFWLRPHPTWTVAPVFVMQNGRNAEGW
jgi:hypothetical protein